MLHLGSVPVQMCLPNGTSSRLISTQCRCGSVVSSARIEVCEGRDRVLLFSVRRPPHLWTSRVEILSPEDEPLGYFTWKAFSRLLSQPFPIHDAGGRLLLEIRPEFLRGRLNLLDAGGRYLGNMMTEAAYLGGGNPSSKQMAHPNTEQKPSRIGIFDAVERFGHLHRR